MKRKLLSSYCGAGLLILLSALPVRWIAGVEPSLSSGSLSPLSSNAVLTNADQVHRLSREEAARGYPTRIRGVVTCALPDSEAVVVQDATRGIYVSQLGPGTTVPPAVGEVLEIEGITDPGEFAPQLLAQHVEHLGMGELPIPIQPTWDQLINGSLDTQLVELQGIVTSIEPGGLTLLTHGGKIKTLLFGSKGTFNNLSWTHCENALIRLRGCLFAAWEPKNHQVRVGEVRMFSPSILLEEAAPTNLFAIPSKRVPELLQFDPRASNLRRVKTSGIIVHPGEEEFFAMDGTNGFRFIPKVSADFNPGDEVEVVGFPVLTGPSPVLREATARKLGSLPLPEPTPLSIDSLFQPEHDATRVRVEGTLVGISADQRTLEMQAGLRRFLARLAQPEGSGKTIKFQAANAPLGSRLQLTGIYSGHGGSRTTGADIGSFELLLNSPGDIQVLGRPPFWSLQRLLLLSGGLAAVLVLSLAWIRLLQYQVQDRTARLRLEIQEREQAEHQHALAQERARIARDLHDDLGSSLTEITMLATRGPGIQVPPGESSERLETIAGKSRTLVHALDEIVWAVDPQRDTLASVAWYLASYTEEYLAGLNLPCRVQVPNTFPDQVIPGEVRHHLFLAVKEALNNAVRHAGATEFGFRVGLTDHRLEILITDNGNGFDLGGHSNGNGIHNLHNRLESLQGGCQILSNPGSGTTVSLHVPLMDHFHAS